MITDRFNTSSEYEVVGQFHKLKQMRTMLDHVDRFEDMVTMVKRHNPSFSDKYFTSNFISGLKDQIQYHLQCHKPTSLSEAYWYAKRLEQTTPQFKKFTAYNPQNKSQRPEVKENKEKDKPLLAQTLAELKAAGKCFKCREPWTPGHSKICKAKQIYSVILIENAEGSEEIIVVEDRDSAEATAPQEHDPLKVCKLSVQALNGTLPKVGTFTLKLKINGHTAIALVDSGSDATFINPKFAIRAICLISDVETVQVTTSQGKMMLSSTTC
jgi:hypothetical protein